MPTFTTSIITGVASSSLATRPAGPSGPPPPGGTVVTVVTVTASSLSTTPTTASSNSSGLSTGAIAGIAIAASLGVVALGALVLWCCICSRQQARRTSRRSQVDTYLDAKEKTDFAPGHRPRPSDTPLLYNDPEKEQYPPRTRDVASSVYTWLQRQPSKYSVLSLYPDRAESKSRVNIEFPSAIMEEEDSPFTPPPQKSTTSNLPPLSIPVYIPPLSVAKRKPDVPSSVAPTPDSARSDGSETESIYSQASASTIRLHSVPTLQKNSVSAASPVPSIPEHHPLPVVSSPKRMFSYDDEEEDRRVGSSTSLPSVYSTSAGSRTLPHTGLQLPPTEEPEPQLERGNTRTVAQLLLTRAKRQAAAKERSGAMLSRENTTASKISHIERADSLDSIHEFAYPSPISEESEPRASPLPVPLSLTPGMKTPTTPHIPPPSSSSFDVDMPVSMDRVSKTS